MIRIVKKYFKKNINKCKKNTFIAEKALKKH